jgi:preprotein translocase subunit SecE
MIGKIGTFIQESRSELKKVDWPSRNETIRFTIFVIVLSIVIAAFLGALDFVFVKILQSFFA